MTRNHIVLLLLLACLALGGCNTIRGVGQDIQQAGEAIEDAGDDNDD